MSIDRFFTRTSTIYNPSTDPTDSTVDDEGVPSVVADSVTALCHVQPYGTPATGEVVLGRDEARRARRIWWPAGTLVSYNSTVVIGIERFTIAGDPDTWDVGSPGDHIKAIIVRQLVPADLSGASA